MADVIATERGYFGGLREAGDRFTVPDGAKGSWFKPVDGGDEPAPAPEPKKRAARPVKADPAPAEIASETAAAGLAPQPDWISSEDI